MNPAPIVSCRRGPEGLHFTDAIRDEYDGGRGFGVHARRDVIELTGQGWFTLNARQVRTLIDYLEEWERLRT